VRASLLDGLVIVFGVNKLHWVLLKVGVRQALESAQVLELLTLCKVVALEVQNG
jgi:hypothetical protein